MCVLVTYMGPPICLTSLTWANKPVNYQMYALMFLLLSMRVILVQVLCLYPTMAHLSSLRLCAVPSKSSPTLVTPTTHHKNMDLELRSWNISYTNISGYGSEYDLGVGLSFLVLTVVGLLILVYKPIHLNLFRSLLLLFYSEKDHV